MKSLLRLTLLAFSLGAVGAATASAPNEHQKVGPPHAPAGLHVAGHLRTTLVNGAVASATWIQADPELTIPLLPNGILASTTFLQFIANDGSARAVAAPLVVTPRETTVDIPIPIDFSFRAVLLLDFSSDTSHVVMLNMGVALRSAFNRYDETPGREPFMRASEDNSCFLIGHYEWVDSDGLTTVINRYICYTWYGTRIREECVSGC